ncbi:MAG TPA: fatty acid desaturase family protein [Candidatus Binatus sp.]|uniref:fatty acid desaturase family protein n=1 Tax=Candidatus Binatus sp. TaxID=2811406 RepID=UPI002B470060|nr:fatty acid desaturase family protein [Candidatus Binatus sp.]HKN14212.1 fatty acid desaturase family protein [Candidatus Binatus sp.]
MKYGSALESSPEAERFGDIGTNVPVKLTREELRELSTVKPALGCIHVGVEWGLIVATICLCQRFWHPMLYVFAVAFIGSRQHALLVLMHDGVHYRLLRNRRLNDWLSEVALAWPHLVTARQYRKNHFAHHRYLNTAQDPDLKRREGDLAWVFPQAIPNLAKTLFRDVTGLNAPAMLKLAVSLASADSVPVGFLAVRYGFYAAALGIIIYAGALEGFALYWIVPMFTWLVLVMRIRGIAEHHAIDIDGPQIAYPRTRTTHATWLERIFLAPKNVNYHIEHHFFPSVPFYRLPELHAILMSKPGFRESAHLTHTYWGVLGESVGRTPSRRGKVRGGDGSRRGRIRRIAEVTV